MRDGVGRDVFEERRVLEQRHLHRFDDAGDAIAALERLEKIEIVDDRERRHERAGEVLLAEQVDAVLHADAGIGLRQHRGRDADRADAAVRDRRRERRHVEHGAAADDHHERLAIEAGVVDHLHQRQRVRDVVLDRFPARARSPAAPASSIDAACSDGIAEHGILQVGIGGRDVIVDDDQQAMPARRLEPRHDRREQWIAPIEHTPREMKGKFERH